MKFAFNLMLVSLMLVLSSCGGSKSSTGANNSLSSGLTTSFKYFVYVANYSDNTISSFSMNRETGILTPLETTSAGIGGNPISLAISPDGNKLYVAKANSASLQVFTINKSNGALSPFQTIDSNDNGQSSVSIASDGRFVYLTSYSGMGNIYSVSSLTGKLIPLKNIELVNPKAYLHPNGELIFLMTASGITFWPLNKGTGEIVISGGAYTAPITQPHTMVVGPDQTRLYTSFYNGYGLINSYNLDLSNRTATPLEMISVGGSAGGIAISNFGKILIATEPNANLLHSYIINSVTGKLTHIESKSTGSYPHQTKFFPDGNYALVVNKVSKSLSIFSVEESSGHLNIIGTTSTGTDPQDIIILKVN